MNEREFDNNKPSKFKDIEENHPYKHHIWEDIEYRLNSHKATTDKKRFAMAAWIPLAALSALFLFSNAAWYYQWRNTNTDVSLLKNSINDKYVVKTSDTIFTKEVVYRYDTLYRTIYKTIYINTKDLPSQQSEITNSKVSSSARSKQMPLSNDELSDKTNNIGNKMLNSNIKPDNQIASANKNEYLDDNNIATIVSEESATRASNKIINQLPMLPFETIKMPTQNLKPDNAADEMIMIKSTEKPFNINNIVSNPSNYGIAITSNYRTPFHRGITKSYGGQFGINAELAINQHWSIIGGGNIGTIYYNINNNDSLFGITVLNPPLPGYTLKELKANNTLTQANIGVKYEFNPINKFTPFLSASYTAQWATNYKGEYTFTNDSGNEIHLIQEQPTSFIQNNLTTFGAGVKYQFAKQWSLLFQGEYQLPFNEKVLLPDIISFGTGIKYQFK